MKIKRILCFTLCIILIIGCCVMAGCITNPPDDDDKDKPVMLDELNLLIIGNSFSEDTMQWVYHIAFEAGVSEINLGVLYIGGSTLGQHFYNARNDLANYEFRTNTDGQWQFEYKCKIGEVLKRSEWEYVVLQQQSIEAGREESFDVLPDLISYVKGIRPNAQILWNMTWSYDDSFTGENFAVFDYSSAKMRTAIVEVAQKVIVPNNDIAMLIPTGTAIQNARTSSNRILTRDSMHLDMSYGRYVAGMMLVRQVTNRPIDDITFIPDGMTELQLQIAKQSVNAAFDKPFTTTQIDL